MSIVTGMTHVAKDVFDPRANPGLLAIAFSPSRWPSVGATNVASICESYMLVDFNQLEHVLDDAEQIGAWQLELRKKNDDPLELDELILHVQKLYGGDDGKLINDLNNRFVAKTEIHPNRIVFHDGDEMSRLQGVGVQLEEQKIIDHRPSTGHRPASNSQSVENVLSAQDASLFSVEAVLV